MATFTLGVQASATLLTALAPRSPSVVVYMRASAVRTRGGTGD